MAAYRTAARLLPGLHVPLLGMGMEYQRMNNLALAEQLFKQAHAICPADPLVCNELGVLAFRNCNYVEAEQWLIKALDRLPDKLPTGTPFLLMGCPRCCLADTFSDAGNVQLGRRRSTIWATCTASCRAGRRQRRLT